ncbi:hypothetical protein EYF80_017973 [Liparis tanakae]|uniref:Uncharacterized protein n=1 Tax=Liparis tanakae TaxID=230148 RepID=A0A4Z2I3G2_9TELE|nr:hypothetical protein EYF80_017973 [Liparis tanakae]
MLSHDSPAGHEEDVGGSKLQQCLFCSPLKQKTCRARLKLNTAPWPECAAPNGTNHREITRDTHAVDPGTDVWENM